MLVQDLAAANFTQVCDRQPTSQDFLYDLPRLLSDGLPLRHDLYGALLLRTEVPNSLLHSIILYCLPC